MSKFVSTLVAVSATLALGNVAMAKSHGHHAKVTKVCMKDGQKVAGVKGPKACKKEGGKWEVEAKATGAEGATATATAPAAGANEAAPAANTAPAGTEQAPAAGGEQAPATK